MKYLIILSIVMLACIAYFRSELVALEQIEEVDFYTETYPTNYAETYPVDYVDTVEGGDFYPDGTPPSVKNKITIHTWIITEGP